MQDRFETTVDLPDDLKSPLDREAQRVLNRNLALEKFLKTGAIPRSTMLSSTDFATATNRSFMADNSIMSNGGGLLEGSKDNF